MIMRDLFMEEVLLVLPDRVDLNKMIDANIAATDSGFMCKLCGSLLVNRGSLRIHFRDQHFHSAVKYSCPVCKTVYKNRNSMGAHMSVYHKNLKGLKLDHCILGYEK
jgi:hypothetical protein